jgi:hypothetical protein
MQRPRLKVLLDETAQVEGYRIEGAFPMFGNNSRGCDQTATAVVDADSKKLVRPPTCRSEHHIRLAPAITDAVVREVLGA